MSLFNPKTNAEKGVHILLSWGFVAAALYYILNTFDIIPDGGILGFLDDAIMTILLVTFAYRLYHRVRKRTSSSAGKVSEYFASHSIVELIFSSKLWITLVLCTAAIYYFSWTYDLIPDTLGPLGHLDDAIAIVTAFTAIMRAYERRK